jgi:hypothetical protein
VNGKILLLDEEEYPNPCESIYYMGYSVYFMDLGEVVKINHPDLALTTPSPLKDNVKG